MISLKDSLKKLYNKVTGKTTNKESISTIIEEMANNYSGLIADDITITTETLTFTYEDETTGTLTVVTGITFKE